MAYDIKWVLDCFDKGMALEYIFFWGHSANRNNEPGKFIFSQWYPAAFIVDNIEYKTAEHWMMAHKAELFGDQEILDKILRSDKPAEAKALGRQIKNFNEDVWNERRFEIVRQGSIHKFEQDKTLRSYLVNTKEKILAEASPTDAIWGIGLSQDSRMIEDPHTWRGLNLLGFALMEARDYLRAS